MKRAESKNVYNARIYLDCDMPSPDKTDVEAQRNGEKEGDNEYLNIFQYVAC